MKQVYIITFHCAYNVGAMLQCYALSQKINELGYNVEVIDYRPEKVMNESIERFWNMKLLQRIGFDSKELLRYIYHGLKNILKNNYITYVYGATTAYRFYSFMKNKIPLTKKVYYSEERLTEFNSKDAVFITGSDQVWNISLSHSPKAYLLDFVKCGSRNSYAASFGGSTIENEYISMFKNALKDYSVISVREESGSKIVKEMADINSDWVLDPVFLLSKRQWERLVYRPKLRQSYIFIYRVESNSEFVKQVKLIKNKTPNIITVLFDGFEDDIGVDYRCTQRGPIDFLSYLFNSEYVITNSFHGTAFSIIANKQARIIPHSTYNERISSLMKIVECDLTDGVYSMDVYTTHSINKQIENSCSVLKRICTQ